MARKLNTTLPGQGYAEPSPEYPNTAPPPPDKPMTFLDEEHMVIEEEVEEWDENAEHAVPTNYRVEEDWIVYRDGRRLPRCRAHSKSTRVRCGRPATQGQRTCYFHGSASPSAREAAKRRWAQAAHPAMALLMDLVEDDEAPVSARLKAADSILDRTGYPRAQKMDVGETTDVLMEKLEVLSIEAQARNELAQAEGPPELPPLRPMDSNPTQLVLDQQERIRREEEADDVEVLGDDGEWDMGDEPLLEGDEGVEFEVPEDQDLTEP